MLLKTDDNGSNFFHMLALNGNRDAIKYVLSAELSTPFKELLLKTDNNGDNFFHYLALSGNQSNIRFFITQHPKLAASLWVKNISGDTVDMLALKANKEAQPPTSILKKAIYEALMRITENPDVISNEDSQLLSAFQDRVPEFLKYTNFISAEVAEKLTASIALKAIFNDQVNNMVKIIFNLHQYQNQTSLKHIPFDNIISALKSVFLKTNRFSSFAKKETGIDIFIDKLNIIHKAIVKDHSPQKIQQAAIVLKLLLQEQTFFGALTKNEKHIFFMLRSIFLNTNEVSALMPRVIMNAGTEVLEKDFDKRLNEIKDEIQDTMSDENSNSAMMVLNGIRYLSENFDLINAFAKNHPNELYYLDTPNENLPFHLEEYGTDDALNKTLLRIVREYIAAFDSSKESGHTKEFFEKSTTGFCLDARVRDLVTWIVQFSGVETLDALMGKYIAEYQAYQKIMGGVSADQAGQIEPVLKFIIQYHADDPYKTEAGLGKITDDVIEKYLSDILNYCGSDEQNDNNYAAT